MKFWTDPSQIELLRVERDKKFSGGPDQNMFLHIGFFLSAYALVEMRVSLFLARALGIDKLRAFDLLTRGMDMRVKIERIRKACENGSAIGPNLHARLNILNDTIRPMRNTIAHSNAIPNPDGTSISFASLVAMPEFVTNRHPEQNIPEKVEMLQLFEYSAWLRLFNLDLRDAVRGQVQQEIFETDPPHSPLPSGSDQSHVRPKPDAKSGRRERKRVRKGQPTRR